MPLNRYFRGRGEKVMRAMRKTYDDPEKAKRIFYATANKRGETPAKLKRKYRAGAGA